MAEERSRDEREQLRRIEEALKKTDQERKPPDMHDLPGSEQPGDRPRGMFVESGERVEASQEAKVTTIEDDAAPGEMSVRELLKLIHIELVRVNENLEEGLHIGG